MLAQELRITDGIVESQDGNFIVLSPAQGRPSRRVLHVNSYGGRFVWEQVKKGLLPGHQLLGCIELVRMGYEVALADPLPDFYLHKNPLPHDLRMLRFIRSWLGRDGIVYCGHNVLYWLPFLNQLGAVRTKIVSMLYAREPLKFARAHAGILGLTPAGTAQAQKLAPHAKVTTIGWGVDLNFYRKLPYNPEWFLSCGIANRDFRTLSQAAARTTKSIRVVCAGLPKDVEWPKTVTLIDGGPGWNIDKTKKLTVQDLLTQHYPRSAGSLVIMKYDPTEYTANGFTNVIEAMAMGQPLIVTRTGALPGEIDVEKAGCGFHVPANDPDALASAIERLANDPQLAQQMGEAGRRLCEKRYNMDRYTADLHEFFNSLG